MFLHLSVSHSVHRGGGVYPSMQWVSTIQAAALVLSLSWCGGSIQVRSNAWWDRLHDPQDQPPPQADPPRTRHPPSAVHAGRYGQLAGGMHPTGIQSCFIVYRMEFYKTRWSCPWNSDQNASKMGYLDISIYHFWLKCLPIWDIN